jgi:single-stranded DNA-binding protein
VNSVTIIGFVGADPEQRQARNNGSKSTKITSWSIRADVVRKLDRNEQEPEAPASGPAPESDEASF